ncbi:MAG TPA: hypothetical protein VF394_11715 [Candidatus Acidoferrum sp.]
MKKQNAIRVFHLLRSVTITLFLAGILVPSLMGSSSSANHSFFAGSQHTMKVAGFVFKHKFQNILAALLGTVFGGVIALVMASRARTKENSGSAAAAHGMGENAGPAHQSGSAVAKSFSWLGGLFALL